MMKGNRLIAMFLVFCLLLPMLVSCADKKANEVGGYVEAEDIDLPETKAYDNSTTELVTEMYGNNKYNGYQFNILGISPGNHFYYKISDQANEIWYEEDSADVQQHSVFQRNILTEDLLDMKITYQGAGDAYDMYDLARTNAQAGVDDFDLMIAAHFRGLLSGMLGYYHNLYDIDSLDMDAYWWNREYIDTFTYEHNKLYNITGDALILDDLAVMVEYYNLAMIEDSNLEDPADLTDRGEWTIEKMVELASKVTRDANGDGQMDSDDVWGILDNGCVALISYFDGCGVRVAEKDENDVPYLAAEESDFIEAVQFVFETVNQSGTVYGDMDEDVIMDMLKGDQGLFYQSSLTTLFSLRDMESDFRFVPMPKRNTEKTRYTSVTSGAVTTVFAVPITVMDTDRVGMFLNVFGGYSTDTVDRALYEVLLGAQLMRDKRSVEMLDYCLDSKYYDWGKDLKWAFPIYQAISDQGHMDSFYFVSSIKRVARQSRSMLKQLLGGYSFY